MNRASCQLCGTDSIEPLYGALHEQIGYRFGRCRACGFIHHIHLADPRDRRQFYRDEYYRLNRPQAESEGRTRLFSALLGELERTCCPGRLLDVGCSSGTFPALAARRGWVAQGVDPSPEAVQAGRLRHNIAIQCGALEDVPEADGTFDAITFWNILDQIADPAQVLRSAHRLLRPGGTAGVRVPNGSVHHLLRSLGARFPALVKRWGWAEIFSVHEFSYTSRTLAMMLRKHGFVSIRCRNSPPTRGDTKGRGGRRHRACLTMCKRLTYGVAEGFAVLTANRLLLGPSLLAFARKPGTANGQADEGEIARKETAR